MMTNDQCEQSTTVSLSISNSANLKYHDWSLGRRKCCGVFYSSNIDIASCQLRGSWTWKMLRLEITGSGTGWRSKQLFYGGRYEQRLDYKFVKEKRGLQQNKRGWICIEDEAISWAGLKPEKVEVRANLKLPILPDEALWESKCSLGNYKFEWSLKRTHHIVESAQVVSESSKVVPGQKSCWRHIWVQI